MPDMDNQSPAAPRRTPAARPRRTGPRRSSVPHDRFFRHIVASTRNGVIALRRDRTMALMNDEADRIFALVRRPEDIKRPFTEVLRDRPDAARALAAAFEM